jgi:hypothetical protein
MLELVWTTENLSDYGDRLIKHSPVFEDFLKSNIDTHCQQELATLICRLVEKGILDLDDLWGIVNIPSGAELREYDSTDKVS